LSIAKFLEASFNQARRRGIMKDIYSSWKLLWHAWTRWRLQNGASNEEQIYTVCVF